MGRGRDGRGRGRARAELSREGEADGCTERRTGGGRAGRDEEETAGGSGKLEPGIIT